MCTRPSFIQSLFSRVVNSCRKAATHHRKAQRHGQRSSPPAKPHRRKQHSRFSLVRWSTQSRQRTVIAYHGTPTLQNAQSILRDGWMVGNGNLYGDGLYFSTKRETAKGYARGNGAYLKCSIRIGRTCHWNSKIQSQFDAWCRKRHVAADNSAKTAFLLQKGFHTLKSDDVIVVLQPAYRNATAWKRKQNRVRVLSVHSSTDDRRIRV